MQRVFRIVTFTAQATVYSYYILHNKKYIGIYEIHGKVYTNTYPAIVPTETFEKVRQRIEINRIGQVSRDTVFLLKGKVFCGYCGKTNIGRRESDRLISVFENVVIMISGILRESVRVFELRDKIFP